MAVETRTHREPKLTPQTPEDETQVPQTFRLDLWTTPQRRDGHSRAWLATGPPEVKRLVDGITRAEMATLIADAADWLAYLGEDA